MYIANRAENRGLKIVPHNFASPLSTAANYHLLCATTNGDLLEIDATGSPLQMLPFKVDGRCVDKGELLIQDRPGLGIEPDPVALRTYSLN